MKLKEKVSSNAKLDGILNIISASIGVSRIDSNKEVQEITFSVPVLVAVVSYIFGMLSKQIV